MGSTILTAWAALFCNNPKIRCPRANLAATTAVLLCIVLGQGNVARASPAVLKIAIIPTSKASSTFADLAPLADRLNAAMPFGAWVVGSGKCPLTDQCDPLSAAAFIWATKQSDNTYTLSANLVQGGTLGTLTHILDFSKISDQDIASLLGTPTFEGGKLSLAARGYSTIVQIIQETNTTNDFDYTGALKELLARRGLTAERSAYSGVNLGAVNTPAACTQGQRYLIFSVTPSSNAKFLSGHTRLGAKVAAYMDDCVSMTSIPFAGENAMSVPSTSATLASFSTFLAFLIPHFSWTNIAQADLAFAKIVDVDPTSDIVQRDVAATALMRAVDRMCDELYVIEKWREHGVLPSSLPTPPPDFSSLMNMPGFTPFSLPPLELAPSPPPTEAGRPSLPAYPPPPLPPGTGTAQTAGTAGQGSSMPFNPLTAALSSYAPPLMCNPSGSPNVLH